MAEESTKEPTIRDFNLTGSFYVDPKLKEDKDTYGDIIGYTLSNGKKARLVVALEIESEDGKEHEYITAEKEMIEIGMELGVYHRADFEIPQDIME